jgi:carbamoyl-phosphate synthase large subunit
MVNSNPETVSTDYDTSDLLFFEPLTPRTCSTSASASSPIGVIVQFGGQTPLNLARPAGGRRAILGTSSTRSTWPRTASASRRCSSGSASASRPTARPRTSTRPSRIAPRSATRCSCGRPTCSAAARWRSSTTSRAAPLHAEAVEVVAERPVLVDRSSRTRSRSTSTPWPTATLRDRRDHGAHRGGRVHSGDSACSLPPYSLPAPTSSSEIRGRRSAGRGARGPRADERAVRRQGQRGLRPRGQPARVADRALRRKAIGVPLAKIAAKVMAGIPLTSRA